MKEKNNPNPPVGQTREVGVDELYPSPLNARKTNNLKLDGLIKSIQRDGKLESLHVRTNEKKGKKYEIVGGLRGFLAGKEAGLSTFTVMVHDDWDDLKCMVMSSLLNDLHLPLNPIDRGNQLKLIIHELEKRGMNKKEDSVKWISENMCMTRTEIYDSLQAIKLSDDVKDKIQEFPKSLVPRLEALPEEKQLELLEVWEKRGLKRDDTSKLIKIVELDAKIPVDELAERILYTWNLQVRLTKELFEKLDNIVKKEGARVLKDKASKMFIGWLMEYEL